MKEGLEGEERITKMYKEESGNEVQKCGFYVLKCFKNLEFYSRFQITFHFVAKFGSSLRSSKVRFRIHKPVCKQRL